MKPVVAVVTGIMEEFGPQGLELVDIDEQAEDLHRVHFRLSGQNLHLAVDEEALYAFNLDLTDVLLLSEEDQPGVIRAALGAINRIQGSLHYIRFLLRDPNPRETSVYALDEEVDKEDFGWLLQPLPEQNAFVSLNFDIPLFGDPSEHWVDAFRVAIPFLFDGANRLGAELQAEGFTAITP